MCSLDRSSERNRSPSSNDLYDRPGDSRPRFAKATHEELDRIVALLEKEGIPATASY